MRLNGAGGCRASLEALGAPARRDQAARLVIGYVLRRGGAVARPLFDDEGRRLGTEPLWGPTARAQADWRLSGQSALLPLQLRATLDGSAEPWTARPRTLADLLFWQALADHLGQVALGDEVELAERLLVASPLAALELAPGVAPDWTALEPLLGASWVVPYLGDHWVRAWLAADARRGRLERADEARLNERQAVLFEGLLVRWQAQRGEHLVVLVRYLCRRLRLADGPAGVLRVARRGDWTNWSTRDREQFEAGLGRIFALGERLAAWAEELRGLGWQRTEADEAFLGCAGRDLAPRGEGLRRLHHELCRIV